MKIGMGWLGWTEQQTLDTSMPAILLAYEGRIELLKACFGSGKEPEADAPTAPEAAPVPPPTTQSLQAIFRAAAK